MVSRRGRGVSTSPRRCVSINPTACAGRIAWARSMIVSTELRMYGMKAVSVARKKRNGNKEKTK